MKILKFGGTSVGSPERMKKLLDIVNVNERQIVVLSAVSGTTNSLAEISSTLQEEKKEAAKKLIDELEAKYVTFVTDLYADESFLEKGLQFIAEHFSFLHSFIQDSFGNREERVILAQGELISTALWHLYLQERGMKPVLLPALDFMKIDEHSEPIIPFITEHLQPMLNSYPDVKLFITQGYICRNSFGEVDNLKRGGSDYTASLIGAALLADEVQIWTDIDGMHNNDPRIVKNTKPIAQLSFDEAAELAYFGAKILHPQSVLPAQRYNIPVRLLNTMQPEARGTLISAESKGNNIKAVAAKDNITAVKIYSSRMLMAYGFLRRVFEVFERYRTPIDMITTSEVAVSLTIDNSDFLKDIIDELKEYGTVEVEKDQTIICIVGDFLADKKGYAARIFGTLKEVPVRMISYGGSKNNVSILVNTEHKNTALQALHEGLFN